MSDKELNIKSSTIEKGLELAKDFLGKLIFPAIEEVGLLMGDNIKVWRFKNQVRLLNNVEKYVTEKNISTKKVPLKILLPLLENASLEEEPLLNEMWENLLINYVDSSKTFNSIIYPKILSEISSSEAKFIKSLNNYLKSTPKSLRIEELNNISILENKSISKITPAEISNLIRLGILKEKYFTEEEVFLSRKLFRAQNKIPKSTAVKISFTDLGKEFLKICEIEK